MLLRLSGAVVLLPFATRMVRTGVERVGGLALRRHLQRVLANTAVWMKPHPGGCRN
jgi:Na+/phosphate symporter